MEAEEVVADLQVCVNKLKDAEAVALKLQERLIAVQETADAAESQYTAVSESLEKSKEELCKADADKEKEITELVKDLQVPCAL